MAQRPEALRGLGFLLAWMVVGGVATSLTLRHFSPYLIGGFSEPPLIFWICLNLGFFVLPILLIFGGIPAAILIMRNRRWKPAAIISFVVAVTTWAVLTFVVVFGPSVWGWTW